MGKEIRKNEEAKYVDQDNSVGVDFSAAGAQFNLTTIGSGSTVNARTGDKIRVKSVELRYILQVSSSTSTNYVRVIMFQWHPMSTAVAPLPASVLQVTGAPTSGGVLSAYSVANFKDYTILYDKTHALVGSSDTQISWPVHFMFTGAKFFDREIHFAAGSSTVMKNGIYLMAISDDGAAPYPNFTCYSRVRYTDA